MKKGEIKSILKKGDILIIISVIIVSLFWFMCDFSREGEDKTVIIRSGGEVCHSISLSDIKDEQRYTVDGCLIGVLPDGAMFISSECPDALCVKRGLMSRDGDVMACVPEGVTVEIVSSKSRVDGITY